MQVEHGLAVEQNRLERTMPFLFLCLSLFLCYVISLPDARMPLSIVNGGSFKFSLPIGHKYFLQLLCFPSSAEDSAAA